ncbi:MAG: YfiR family protein [Bacillus subtilis]|nr:YfiR family protein [Bacillus subtilis]
MKRTLVHAVVFSLLVLLFPEGVPVSGQYLDKDVKAAIVKQLVKFVEWPSDAIGNDPAQPFDLVIFGEDPFSGKLHDLMRGERIQGHPVRVRVAPRVAEVKGAQLVFIPESRSDVIPELVQAIGDDPVLTVSESPDACLQGILVNFYKEASRIKFEIQFSESKRRGLRIPSMVLKLARIVGPSS